MTTASTKERPMTLKVELALGLGPLLMLLGTALAINYKGIATRHVQISLQTVRLLKPPILRRGQPPARRITMLTTLDRALGVIFTIQGAVAIAIGGYLLFTR
jgi:hypothetical protein